MILELSDNFSNIALILIRTFSSIFSTHPNLLWPHPPIYDFPKNFNASPPLLLHTVRVWESIGFGIFWIYEIARDFTRDFLCVFFCTFSGEAYGGFFRLILPLALPREKCCVRPDFAQFQFWFLFPSQGVTAERWSRRVEYPSKIPFIEAAQAIWLWVHGRVRPSAHAAFLPDPIDLHHLNCNTHQQ